MYGSDIETMATISARLKSYPVLIQDEKAMPDKICRACGEELVGFARCSECNRSIQQICINCGKRTLERFHLQCFSQIRCDLPISTRLSLAE